MKTQHTPGPWIIDSFAQIGDDKSIIGRVYCGDIFPNDDMPECTANARLIAAAPELLESLEAVIQLIDNGYLVRDISKDHEPDWAVKNLHLVQKLGQAVKAISKAKGL